MILVYPWNTSNFQGSVEDMESVYYNLKKLGYPVGRFSKIPEDKSMIIVLQKICFLALENKWIVVMSNNNKIMQALAKLLPITYSLTSMRSCFNTSTLNLWEFFTARRPYDIVTPYPEGEALHKVATAGLLVWEGLTDTTSGLTKVSGRFAELLRKRLDRKCSTVFMVSYLGVYNDSAVERIRSSISSAVGINASSIIEEVSEFKNYTIKTKEFVSTSMEIG